VAASAGALPGSLVGSFLVRESLAAMRADPSQSPIAPPLSRLDEFRDCGRLAAAALVPDTVDARLHAHTRARPRPRGNPQSARRSAPRGGGVRKWDGRIRGK
jgi:hypothetical protein